MSGALKQSVKDSMILCLAQLVFYIIVAINLRAIAQADYFVTGITGGVIALLSFLTIKIVTKKTDHPFITWSGYVIGCVCGDLMGIFISKILLGS